MSYLNAIAALQAIRNALPSLDKVESVLAAAASAENAVKESLAKRTKLIEDSAALELAIGEAQEKLVALEVVHSETQKANLAYKDATLVRINSEVAAKRKEEFGRLDVEVAKHKRDRDALADDVAKLKNEKSRLEAAVSQLTQVKDSLKAKLAGL